MKHIVIEKQKGYKTKLIDQRFGITIAKELFNKYLNNQEFLFNWEDNPIKNNPIITELRFCYHKNPVRKDVDIFGNNFKLNI